MKLDALRTYVNVIEDAFGSEVDFAQLHKVYRAPMENETRYSPGEVHRLFNERSERESRPEAH